MAEFVLHQPLIMQLIPAARRARQIDIGGDGFHPDPVALQQLLYAERLAHATQAE